MLKINILFSYSMEKAGLYSCHWISSTQKYKQIRFFKTPPLIYSIQHYYNIYKTLRARSFLFNLMLEDTLAGGGGKKNDKRKSWKKAIAALYGGGRKASGRM